MMEYAKYLDCNKTMSFKFIDKKLFKKYTKIWKKWYFNWQNFDNEPVYADNDKYRKIKIK